MNRYRMRDLIAMEGEELFHRFPKERHIIEFDDGELETHTNATIVSTYFCYALTAFPDVPILKEYHLGTDIPSGDVFIERLNKVAWDIHSFYNETVDSEWLAKLCFRATNRYFNDIKRYASAYYTSMSMFDIYEIMEHPDIKDALANVEPNGYSITEVTYPKIRKVLLDPDILPLNPIKQSAQSGTLKVGQLMQMVGPIGYRADLSQDILDLPIVNPLLEGVSTLYGAMAESRTGTISLINNKDLLRKTEYFNRMTQLVAQYVQRLHLNEDCGTTYHGAFFVTKENLKTLIGKYHLTESGEEWIRGTETHLIDTQIKLRSVLSCVHPDPSGICGKCYGRLQYSVPHRTNIGQISAVVSGDKITSSVLATKHHAASSSVERYHLGAREASYLTYGQEEEALYLVEHLRKKRVRITFYRDEAKSLANILMINTLDEYPIHSVSQLTRIAIEVFDEDGTKLKGDVLQVSLYNRLSSLSRYLLEHMREVKWVIDQDDNIMVDLDGFDKSLPILVLPKKHVSMDKVMMKIRSFLHSGSEGSEKKLAGYTRKAHKQQIFLKQYRNPMDALMVFNNMLNEKLYVNITHTEILLYAMMVRHPGEDMRLPIPGMLGSFDTYNNVINGRSLSAVFAYEKQDSALLSPLVVGDAPRMDHPYDIMSLGGDLYR